MPVSGAIVEKPSENGRKTRIKSKHSIFFVNDGHGAAWIARDRSWFSRVAADDSSPALQRREIWTARCASPVGKAEMPMILDFDRGDKSGGKN
jgi:hypothetical protein